MREQGAPAAMTSALPAQVHSDPDKAVTLIDGLNHMRVVRDDFARKGLKGSADVVTEAMARIRFQLRVLQEENGLDLLFVEAMGR